jgi:hypothetical protein
MEIYGPIPIELNLKMVQTKLRTPERQSVANLMEEALALAEARAVVTVAYIEEKGDDQVVIGGQRFKSRVLRKNLEDIGRVFPAVVTIGSRLEEKAAHSADMLTQYYLDMIGNLILAEARLQMIRSLCRKFALDALSWMSPGSLEDWPIDEQRPLFGLLAEGPAAIGVQLTESLLMLPRKSVSGIFFPAASTFFSCRLCPRERCDSRKARYDEAAAREYGVFK